VGGSAAGGRIERGEKAYRAAGYGCMRRSVLPVTSHNCIEAEAVGSGEPGRGDKSNQKMVIATSLIAEGERYRDLTNGTQVLAFLEDRFRALGATHFLATGVPLPGRPIEPLVLRITWGEVRGDRPPPGVIAAEDAILQAALRSHRAFALGGGADDLRILNESPLLRQANGAGGRRGVVAVPVHAFPPYQACVIAAGPELALDARGLIGLDHFTTEGFRRLLALRHLRPDRPGDLSARERKVVELSAFGKTANEIASVLKISQRTVHAHLQNASEKLRASNKTQTVVEALRYGQISM
jgi:LuxR family quorum sensing-dependent transcriptional regulator